MKLRINVVAGLLLALRARQEHRQKIIGPWIVFFPSFTGPIASPKGGGFSIPREKPTRMPAHARSCSPGEVSMRYYITMFVKAEAGGWRAVFPDFPDCEAAGDSLDATTFSAVMALTQHAHDRGAPLPRPSSLSDVQGRADWIARQGIALERTIVSLIPLNGFDHQKGPTS